MSRACPHVVWLWLASALPVGAGASYSIIDLGGFGVGHSVQATAINDNGVVVGADFYSTTATAFYWDGSLHALAPLPGDTGAGANAINSLGWITGPSIPQATQTRGARWVNGVPSLLPVTADPVSGPHVNPMSINTTGSVVGSYRTGNVERAFLLLAKASSSTDLGTLGGPTASAYAINDTGVVVGTADGANGNGRAFSWHAGQMNQLSDLGLSSAAYCLNAQNVAGGWLLRSDFSTQAVLWSANGTRTALPGLAGYADAEVWSVNQNLLAVGDADGHAVLWSNGSVQNLLNLIPGDSGWSSLNYAYGINDAGEIVGFGRRDNTGVDHAFLLVPVPEPQSLFGLGLALLLLGRARPAKPGKTHRRLRNWGAPGNRGK